MESYYNHLLQHSSSRRTSNAIERFTDPETVTNYLCGYSLRICTLYLLWIHLVFNLSVLCMLIIAHTYITIGFNVDHTPHNNTLYTVTANKEKLFDIDMYSKGLDQTLKFISNKLAELLLSWIILDVIITTMALCGVYLNKILLMVPYKMSVFTNVVWLIILFFVEVILWLSNLITWNWISATIITLLLIKDIYRFSVLYSYFHMIGKHFFANAPRTPQYMATQSPRQLNSPVIVATTTASMATNEASSEVPLAKMSLSSQASDKVTDTDSVDKG